MQSQGEGLEQMSAAFLMIQLPSLDTFKQGYDQPGEVDFMIQGAIGELVDLHIGDHTLIPIKGKLGIQVHSDLPKGHGRTCIANFAMALDQGITLKFSTAHTQLQWVSRPRIGVLESCKNVDLAQRIAQAAEALDSMSNMGHRLRAPMNVAYFNDVSSVVKGDRMSNWRKERVLRVALQDQELELEFIPAKDAITDSLTGFRASFASIVKYDGAEVRLKHADIMQASDRLGLAKECSFLALKSALNQCRVWQLLVPGNDTSITISLDADILMQTQSSILAMLRTYKEVANQVIIALNVNSNSVVANQLRSLNEMITDLNESTGVRFAITEFGMSHLNLQMAQEVDVQVIYLAGQWPDTSTSHTFNDPILPSLIELLHSFRTEVVATNIGTEAQLKNLKSARIDRYESSTLRHSALCEDEALHLIEQQQVAISSTIINAQFRFRHAN